MRTPAFVLFVGVLAGLLAGCASQHIVSQEFYEPNPDTIHRREDGLTVGALKSETTKLGSPDWSGNKSFSIIGIGN